jgi:hypothetical protein
MRRQRGDAGCNAFKKRPRRWREAKMPSTTPLGTATPGWYEREEGTVEEVTLDFGDVRVTAHPNGRRPLLVITHEGQLVDRLKLDPDDLREREKAAEMLEARLPGRRWLTILRDVAQALAEATQVSEGLVVSVPSSIEREHSGTEIGGARWPVLAIGEVPEGSEVVWVWEGFIGRGLFSDLYGL